MMDKRSNMLKALAVSSWGQDKETLLLTYNAFGKYIASYAAPIWSTNASDPGFKKIQTSHNSALRTAMAAHMMASIDHLHHESLKLKIRDHSRHVLCAVPCELSRGGPRESWHHISGAKTQPHEGNYSH